MNQITNLTTRSIFPQSERELWDSIYQSTYDKKNLAFEGIRIRNRSLSIGAYSDAKDALNLRHFCSEAQVGSDPYREKELETRERERESLKADSGGAIICQLHTSSMSV